MKKLRDAIDTIKLDEMCKIISSEFDEISTSTNKLKLVLVLVHIIEESQKILGSVDINFFLEVLKKRIEEVCEQTENQKRVQTLRYYQDKFVRDIVDGTSDELSYLEKEIEPLLVRYEQVLKSLVEIRDNMPLAQRTTNQEP